MWRGTSDLHPHSSSSRSLCCGGIYEALCRSLLCCCSFPVLWEMPEASQGEITERFCFHWHCHCASNTYHPKYEETGNTCKLLKKGVEEETGKWFTLFDMKTGQGKTLGDIHDLSHVCNHRKIWWWHFIIRHKLSCCKVLDKLMVFQYLK